MHAIVADVSLVLAVVLGVFAASFRIAVLRRGIKSARMPRGSGNKADAARSITTARTADAHHPVRRRVTRPL